MGRLWRLYGESSGGFGVALSARVAYGGGRRLGYESIWEKMKISTLQYVLVLKKADPPFVHYLLLFIRDIPQKF